MITVALATGLLLLSGACNGEDRSDTASRVARDWSMSNVAGVAQILGELVTEDVPVLQGLAASLAAAAMEDQINERLNWTYSKPEEIDTTTYRVTATASSEIGVNLLLITRTYRISADVVLVVDTDAKEVSDWNLDPRSFRVEEL